MNWPAFKRHTKTAPASGLVILFALLITSNAFADLSQRDLQVLSRTLGFLNPPFSGTVIIGIVYDPKITTASINVAEIRSALGDGLKVGTLNLLPEMVTMEQAAEANVDIFLLTAGNGDSAAKLGSVIASKKTPCLTFDMEQVQAGNCLVGLQAQPKVEIVVNRSLAEMCEVSFASIFLMMIKEI